MYNQKTNKIIILYNKYKFFVLFKVRSAKKIQRWYREILTRRAELERRRLEAVVSVQSKWRMILAKKRYEVKIQAIKKIQRWFRIKRAQRIEYERRLLVAVVLAQTQWRMIYARRIYQSKVCYKIIKNISI